jgi:hypothetical protein
MQAVSSDVYQHEMPGGQYTNLKFQAASLGLGAEWDKVCVSYAAANRALGDIVKVSRPAAGGLVGWGSGACGMGLRGWVWGRSGRSKLEGCAAGSMWCGALLPLHPRGRLTPPPRPARRPRRR